MHPIDPIECTRSGVSCACAVAFAFDLLRWYLSLFCLWWLYTYVSRAIIACIEAIDWQLIGSKAQQPRHSSLRGTCELYLSISLCVFASGYAFICIAGG